MSVKLLKSDHSNNSIFFVIRELIFENAIFQTMGNYEFLLDFFEVSLSELGCVQIPYLKCSTGGLRCWSNKTLCFKLFLNPHMSFALQRPCSLDMRLDHQKFKHPDY